MQSANEATFFKAMTSVLLLSSLLALLVNDWHLKQVYGNWFTGKLSDFAGILLLSLVLFSLLPSYTRSLAICICLCFCFWKSPYSEHLIKTVQAVGLPRFGRVVDYTDLLSLSMVPVGMWFIKGLHARQVKWESLRRVLAVPVFVIACLGMTATTMATFAKQLELESVPGQEELDRAAIASAIQRVAMKYKLECVDCANPELEAIYAGGRSRIAYRIGDDQRVRLFVGTQYSLNRVPLGLPDGTKIRTRGIKRALERELGDLVQKGDIDLEHWTEDDPHPYFGI